MTVRPLTLLEGVTRSRLLTLCSRRGTCFSDAVPVPLILWCGLLLGLAFARAAHGILSQASMSSLSSPVFPIVTAFALLVYAPLAGIALALAPDWACAYFIDSQHIPAGFETFSVLFAALSVVLGYHWGAAPSARGRWNIVGRRLILVGLAFAVTLAAIFSRLKVHATYAQYHGDFGIRPLSGSELGYALIWLLIVFGLGVTWTMVSLYKIGRQPIRD